MDAKTAARAEMPDEMWRILCAVDDGRFSVNKSGRYVIYHEDRPDRRSRELLDRNGLIDFRWTKQSGTVWYVTEKGKDALRAAGFGVHSGKEKEMTEGDILEVCQAANAWATQLRARAADTTTASEQLRYVQAADRIDQAAARLRRTIAG